MQNVLKHFFSKLSLLAMGYFNVQAKFKWIIQDVISHNILFIKFNGSIHYSIYLDEI